MAYTFETAAGYVDCKEQPDGSITTKPYSKLITEFYEFTPVLSKELTEDKQAWRVHGKLRTHDRDEDLTSDEYVSSLSDHKFYVSTVDLGYIGMQKEYDNLRKRGIILFQKIHPSNNTCSIGYSYVENKWYGWSHRAIYGFTIGDKVKEGDIMATSGLVEEYRVQHPEEDLLLPVGFKARTMADAKRMAIAFASAVG